MIFINLERGEKMKYERISREELIGEFKKMHQELKKLRLEHECEHDIFELKRTQEQLQYRLAIEETVANVCRLLLVPGEPDINEVLKILGEMVAVNRVYIFEIRENGMKMDNTYEWCVLGTSPEIDNLQDLDTGIFPWWMDKLIKGETIAINNVNIMPPEASAEQGILQAQNIQSLLVVPIYSVKRELLGYMGFDDTEKCRQWIKEDIQALNVVMEILGSFWERRQAEKKLQLSEARYRAVVEDQTELICRFLVDGTITFVNDAFYRYFNNNYKDFIGKNLMTLLSEEVGEIFQETLETLSQEDTLAVRTVQVKKSAEEFAWIEYTGRMIIDKEDKFSEYQVVGHDITEKRQMEVKVALMNKMEAVGQLAAGIAHEINTPLQYAVDNNRFLQDVFADFISLVKDYRSELWERDEIKEILPVLVDSLKKKEEEIELDYLLAEIPLAIEQTLEGLQRVKKLVLTMKEFSHPGIKEKQLADINQGIEASVVMSCNEWKYFAELKTHLDNALPKIPCVIDEINQVILNMIINATDAIKEAVKREFYKKGKIEIQTEVRDDYVNISISDNGIGIAESIQDRIFEPFFTTKDIGKGTGQGLTIAHDIVVNKHGGIINLSSEENHGTTFIISLPLF